MSEKARIVMKPWGYEEIWAETECYVGKLLFIAPDQRLSLQFHKKKSESLRVLSGIPTIVLGDEIYTCKPGDLFHIKPGVVHRFANYTSEQVVLIEVSSSELDDVVRVKDDYNREK